MLLKIKKTKLKRWRVLFENFPGDLCRIAHRKAFFSAGVMGRPPFTLFRGDKRDNRTLSGIKKHLGKFWVLVTIYLATSLRSDMGGKRSRWRKAWSDVAQRRMRRTRLMPSRLPSGKRSTCGLGGLQPIMPHMRPGKVTSGGGI